MTDLQSATLYIDANPFIYALEGPEDLSAVLKELFIRLKDRPAAAVTSELTIAEVLPKRRVPDREYLELLVWSKVFDLRPISRDILYGTADYRRIASTRLPDGRIQTPKLPDSIHVVTAIKSGCQVFLSSDTKLKLPETMRLVRADIPGVASLIRDFA